MFRSGRQLTGLDCSGLTSICYRSLGVTIPRDASKQAMKTWNKLAATDLQVGDVFYLGMPFSSTDSVTHVMMLHSMAPEPMLVESADNNRCGVLVCVCVCHSFALLCSARAFYLCGWYLVRR